MSEQAVTVGVTAVPTPDSDSGSDLWYVFETQLGVLRVASAIGLEESGGVHTKFDSKAMRKVNDGEQSVSVIETTSVSLGATVNVAFRQLIKLH